jgi:transcriptional regulator with XRE-family HTH domain
MENYIGLNISYLVRKNKMQKDEFGRIFDLNRGAIGSYIDDKAQPKIATLQKISAHFGITLDELISRDLEKSTQNILRGNVHNSSDTHLTDASNITDNQCKDTKNFSNIQENTNIVDNLLHRLENQSQKIGRLEAENEHLRNEIEDLREK